MANKCPPGVLCIENMTLFFIISILILIIYLVYLVFLKNMNNFSTSTPISKVVVNEINNKSGLFPRPSFSFSNIENDVLLNPYEAPLRNNQIFSNSGIQFQNRIPINIRTQSFDTNYRQVGILTRHANSGKETILPLMGRPLITNRNKWNFYAMSESNNMIKLQVSSVNNNNHRNCMSSNGCEDLMNGDLVKVDGYNDLFKVTTYENDTPRYIPYI
jgi:hypothetical protein